MSDWQIINVNSGAIYDPSSISLNVSAKAGSTNATIVIPDFTSNISQIMDDYLTDSGAYYSIDLPSFTILVKLLTYYGRNIGKNSAVTLNGAVQYTRDYLSWSATTEFSADDVVLVGSYLFSASSEGVTGSTAPMWTTSIGSSVEDGDIFWVNIGLYYIETTSLIDPFVIDSVITQEVANASIRYTVQLDDSTSNLWVGDYVKYDGETRVIQSFTYSIQPQKKFMKMLTVSP